MCEFSSPRNSCLAFVLDEHAQDIAFVMLAALAALSFSHDQRDIGDCLQGGLLLTPWLQRYSLYSTKHEMGATHVYVFVPLCLGNQKVLPACLFSLMPETRMVPAWAEHDQACMQRLQKQLANGGDINTTWKKMAKNTKTWDTLSVDLVQIWMKELFTEVRARRQVSSSVLGASTLESVHVALQKLVDPNVGSLICGEILKCMTADVPRRVPPWCSSYIYSVTHTIYVLGSYTHGFKKHANVRQVYLDVHLLMCKMADMYKEHCHSEEQWCLHAEYAIEVTIALNLMSLDENNVQDEDFTVPKSCAATQEYVYAYPTEGTLRVLADRRQKAAARVISIASSMYDEIHTRMVILHALGVFARMGNVLRTAESTAVPFETIVDDQGHKLQGAEFGSVMNFMRNKTGAQVTARDVALALPLNHLCSRSQIAHISHVLAFLCDKHLLLKRKRGTSMPFSNTYSYIR